MLKDLYAEYFLHSLLHIGLIYVVFNLEGKSMEKVQLDRIDRDYEIKDWVVLELDYL